MPTSLVDANRPTRDSWVDGRDSREPEASRVAPSTIASISSAEEFSARVAPPAKSRPTTAQINQREILIFTSQMAIMCKSGVDLAESLQEAARSCKHPRLRPILQEIYASVSNGSSVSEAMRPFENVFGAAYLGSVAAAESSGKVPEVLDRLASLLRNQIRLRSSLIATISYPAALTGISSIVILALVFFVLPQFGTVFDNMNKTPPPLTQMLLHGSKFAREQAAWIAGAAAMLAVAAAYAVQQPYARGWWDHVLLNSSATRSAFRSLLAGRTFRLLGTMLASDVPLLDSVRLCRGAANNRLFQQLFHEMEQDILNGRGITQVVVRAEFLPHGVGQMVSTAERTGRLGQVLEMAGDFYEEDGERQLRQLVKLLEPLIIVVMGLIVATVVASVMLPLLNVTTMSH